MTTENFSHSNLNDSEDLSFKEIVISIRNWYRHLLSKWLFILIFMLIGGIVGFTYAIFKKPIYTATTTFVLEEGGSSGIGLGNLGGIASMVGIDLGGGGGLFTGDNILELYKSRKMIEKALLSKTIINGRQELLIDRFIGVNELKQKWKGTDWNKVSFNDTTKFTTLQDSILGEVVKDIKKNYLNVVKPDKKLSIIKVDVRANDEIFAKVFSNEIVNSVNRFYIDTKTKRSSDNVNILQHKADSVRAIMNGAINVAAAVVDATPNLNPTRQAQRMAPVQRSQFSAETNKAILSELVKNLEMSKMALLKETPLIQEVDQPIYPLEKEKLGRLKGAVLGSFLSIFMCVVIILIKDFLRT